MKTINHQEQIAALRPVIGGLICKRDGYERAWLLALANGDANKNSLWEEYSRIKDEIKNLKAQLTFHTIMAKEKKYAVMWLYSDAHAYEIIEEKSDKTILVRRLDATIKPEAKKLLHDSFVPGGFCGHYDNDLQDWDFAVNENNPIETIRKHKDGRWYGIGKTRFTIEAEPYEKYDYNF